MKDYEDIDDIERAELHRIRSRWKLRPTDMTDRELYNHVKDTFFYQRAVLARYTQVLGQQVVAEVESVMLGVGKILRNTWKDIASKI